MKCPSCMQSQGRENAPDLKVEQDSKSIFMKCPKCGYAKGVKASGYKK